MNQTLIMTLSLTLTLTHTLTLTLNLSDYLSGEALKYKKSQKGPKPMDVVISAFTNEDIDSLSALHGEEILAVASYASNNARLVKTTENQNKITKLISLYPEESKKMNAVGDLIKNFGFKYVYVVADVNAEGDAAVTALKTKLALSSICVEEVSGDWIDMVKQINDKDSVNVVVVSLPEEDELNFYQELENNNVTGLTIITTQGFDGDMSKLNKVADVVDGGFDISYRRTDYNFKYYMKQIQLPFTNRDWLRKAFLSFGGKASCLTTVGRYAWDCGPAKEKLRNSLVENIVDAEYAYQAVLALAYAQQKSLETGEGFLETVKGLHVDLVVLAMDPVGFNSELTASINKFLVYNLRSRGDKVDNRYVGIWDGSNTLPVLHVRKDGIIWSGGSKVIPESVCSAACAPGYVRKFKGGECCWDCVRYPNETVLTTTATATTTTTTTDTDTEANHTSPRGPRGTVQRYKSNSKGYKLNHFKWFGAVLVILMVIFEL